ncbi:MAG: ATP synthase F1 subunit gamma [Candidatus Gastranaerophilaceae bacterium]|jgi:F-type H+-transporting ATPase subunit gamma
MASSRDIKSRIKSVKNTQKITQAMKMVAAAKVKRAETTVKASRPFSNNLAEIFKQLLLAKPEINNAQNLKYSTPIENYPELLKQREIKTVALLVITSDKGLAGSYNATVVKKAINEIKDLKAKGYDTKLFIVGNKGIASLSREFKNTNVEIIQKYTKLPAVPTIGSASVMADDIAEAYIDGKIDKIEIITTKFRSMISYKVEKIDLLPVVPPKNEHNNQVSSEMLFEPSPEVILQKIVPLYISNTIYSSLLEAAASELASRMNAMSNATKNAQEMIQNLTLSYNKIRQASITQEILEVVGGANALGA